MAKTARRAHNAPATAGANGKSSKGKHKRSMAMTTIADQMPKIFGNSLWKLSFWSDFFFRCLSLYWILRWCDMEVFGCCCCCWCFFFFAVAICLAHQSSTCNQKHFSSSKTNRVCQRQCEDDRKKKKTEPEERARANTFGDQRRKKTTTTSKPRKKGRNKIWWTDAKCLRKNSIFGCLIVLHFARDLSSFHSARLQRRRASFRLFINIF